MLGYFVVQPISSFIIG